MTEKKTGPSDEPYYQKGDDDELDEEENKKEENLKKDKKYNKELEDLKKAGEEVEERRKEGLKQYAEKDTEKKEIREKEGEIKIGGQKVKAKKKFTHKKGMGIFIRGRSTNYQRKIRKAFRKVHGVSLSKKKAFEEIIGECAESKIAVKEKDVKNVIAKFKHKTFTGSGSSGIKRMLDKKKKEGVDIKKYKKELKEKFTRRDLDKFKRAIGGKKDPRKHRVRPGSSSSNRNPGRGKPGSTSPSRIGR